MSTGLVTNNIFNSIFNVVLLASIIYVTCIKSLEYRKLGPKAKPLLFAFGLLLNIAAFTCIFVLFWKAFSSLIGANYDSTNPLFFACNMVFLQHTFLIMVLFIRIYYIFDNTDLKLTTRSIILFIIALIISTTIYIILLSTKIRIPGTDSWVNCAVTLCIFNVIFMIVITTLFLTKLASIFRVAMKQKHNSRKTDGLINLITKTTLLSLIAMSITFLSCILLLFRFSIFGENAVVSIISDWVISIDIYANFLCYSLSYQYFQNIYIKICQRCDLKCRNLWFFCMFGVAGKDIKFLNQEIMLTSLSDLTSATSGTLRSNAIVPGTPNTAISSNASMATIDVSSKGSVEAGDVEQTPQMDAV